MKKFFEDLFVCILCLKKFFEDLFVCILCLLFLILFYFILTTSLNFFQNVCGNVISYIKLRHCYLTGYCVPKEFMGKTYPAKTTKEIDTKITSKFYDTVAILNIKSKVIHYDLECKYAKLCTKNCIYIPSKVATKLDIAKDAYGCRYEENIRKLCSNICSKAPDRMTDSCVYSCIDSKYKDEYFNLHKFIESEKAWEEEQEELHSNEYEYEDRFGIVHG